MKKGGPPGPPFLRAVAGCSRPDYTGSIGDGLPEEERDGENHDCDVHGNGSCGWRLVCVFDRFYTTVRLPEAALPFACGGFSPPPVPRSLRPQKNIQAAVTAAAPTAPRSPGRRAASRTHSSRDATRPGRLRMNPLSWNGFLAKPKPCEWSPHDRPRDSPRDRRWAVSASSGWSIAAFDAFGSQRYDFCQGLPSLGAFWQKKGR